MLINRPYVLPNKRYKMLHEELDTSQDQLENKTVRIGRYVALGNIKTITRLTC